MLSNIDSRAESEKKEDIDDTFLSNVRYEYDYNTTPSSEVSFTSNRATKVSAAELVLSVEGEIRFLDVDFIDNAVVNGNGICWAACGASVINYQKGTTLDARAIYNTLATQYNDTPVGTVYWIRKMWNHYGLEMTHKDHKLSYSTINTQLLAHKPIYCCIYNYNAGVGHVVVLMGTYTQNSKVYYIYMDPNMVSLYGTPYLIINSIVPSTLNTTHSFVFYYKDSAGNYYNNWFESYY